MAFPTQREIEIPLLQALIDAGGEARPADIYPAVATRFPDLSDEDQRQRLESGALKWEKDVQFARQRLFISSEIDSPMRGVWRITQAGRDRLSGQQQGVPPTRIRGPRQQVVRPADPVAPVGEEAEAPEVAIDAAYQRARTALVSQLLDRIRLCSPSFFERLVVDLLLKMGYGGTWKDAGEAIGRAGDGGIDGVIKQDRLGLDRVYLQAKRWDTTQVGSPEIQRFAGALQTHRAQKGVFITLSSFSREARNVVLQVESRIVLIDGQELAGLMIDFGVGVTLEAAYEVKSLDSDYFDQE